MAKKRPRLDPGDLESQRAELVLAKYRKRIEALDGVLGVDVGLISINGQTGSSLAIRVYVEEKKESLEDEEQFIPRDLLGVPTDVIVRKNVDEAVCGGAETGSPSAKGTMGIDVYSKHYRKAVMLTCAHVAEPNLKNGTLITSDIPMDDEHGSPFGKVGPQRRVDWEYDAFMDVAVVQLDDPTFSGNGMCDDHGTFQFVEVQRGHLNTSVSFLGKNAGRRTGRITSWKTPNLRINGINFSDHIEVEYVGPNPLGPGDSGAIVCEGPDMLGIIRLISQDDRGKQFAYASKLHSVAGWLGLDP